jgi:hypothetical protein
MNEPKTNAAPRCTEQQLVGLQIPSPCGWVWICNKVSDGWVHLVSGDLRHVNKMQVERFLALREQMKANASGEGRP